jgi:hypothetical protein
MLDSDDVGLWYALNRLMTDYWADDTSVKIRLPIICPRRDADGNIHLIIPGDLRRSFSRRRLWRQTRILQTKRCQRGWSGLPRTALQLLGARALAISHAPQDRAMETKQLHIRRRRPPTIRRSKQAFLTIGFQYLFVLFCTGSVQQKTGIRGGDITGAGGDLRP